jgi:hypothetical protein
VIFGVFLAGITRRRTPVTLTESDLSELLAALQAGEMTDIVRTSREWILQQLIEAQASAVIVAAPFERTETRTNQRNRGWCPPPLGTSSWGSPSSAKQASSHRCWNDADGSTGPCSRW